jgi:hypothetical protein
MGLLLVVAAFRCFFRVCAQVFVYVEVRIYVGLALEKAERFQFLNMIWKIMVWLSTRDCRVTGSIRETAAMAVDENEPDLYSHAARPR